MTPEEFFNSADVLNLRPGDRAVLVKDGKVYVAKNYPEHGAVKITFRYHEWYQRWVKAGEPYLYNPDSTLEFLPSFAMPLNEAAENALRDAIVEGLKEQVEKSEVKDAHSKYKQVLALLKREGGYMTRQVWAGNRKVFYVSPVEQGFEKINLNGSHAPIEPFLVVQQGDYPVKVYTPTPEDRVATDWQLFTKRYVQHS